MTTSEKRVKDWLAGEIDKLQSEEQKMDWLTLREAINDKALLTLPDELYVIHMQMMYLQMLRKCCVQLCSGGLKAYKRDPESYIARMDAVTEPMWGMVAQTENGDYLFGLYSDAWGSSKDKAGMSMLQCFQSIALSERMAEQTLSALDRQIVATFVAYQTASSEAYGTAKGGGIDLQESEGKSSQELSKNMQGNGCLIFIVIGLASFWSISHLILAS